MKAGIAVRAPQRSIEARSPGCRAARRRRAARASSSRISTSALLRLAGEEQRRPRRSQQRTRTWLVGAPPRFDPASPMPTRARASSRPPHQPRHRRLRSPVSRAADRRLFEPCAAKTRHTLPAGPHGAKAARRCATRRQKVNASRRCTRALASHRRHQRSHRTPRDERRARRGRNRPRADAGAALVERRRTAPPSGLHRGTCHLEGTSRQLRRARSRPALDVR